MTTVRRLISQKGTIIWSIHADATVFDAVAKMAEKDIGSLVVMEGEKIVGLISGTTPGMSFSRVRHRRPWLYETSWRGGLSLHDQNNPLSNACRS